MAADFAKVRQGGDASEPEFIGGAALIGCGGSEIREVCSSEEAFVPEKSRGVACESHGTGLPVDRSVEAFYSSIVCRRIGGCRLVVDAEGAAPRGHGFGNETDWGEGNEVHVTQIRIYVRTLACKLVSSVDDDRLGGVVARGRRGQFGAGSAGGVGVGASSASLATG